MSSTQPGKQESASSSRCEEAFLEWSGQMADYVDLDGKKHVSE